MAQSGSSPQPQKPPAVPIEKSVTPDYIVCLEDGKQFKSLKAASQYSRVHAGRISETVESTKGLSNGGFQILEAALSISKEHWIETERVTRKIGQIGQPGTRHRWRVAPKASNRREFGRASSRRYSLRAGQSDLARATGIGKDSVARPLISFPEALDAMAKAFGVSVAETFCRTHWLRAWTKSSPLSSSARRPVIQTRCGCE